MSITANGAPLVVTIDIETTGELAKPVVSGRTNLPNGTLLMISIEGKFNYYGGGAKAVVKDGRFVAGPLYNASSPIKPGSYVIEVVTPLIELQPPEVRRRLGAQGENLAGPLARQGLVGKVVEYRANYTIGGAEGVRVQLEGFTRQSADASALVRNLEDALYKGRQLLKGRPSDAAIGEHTKLINAVVDRTVSTLRRSHPECASAGSAAGPYWWYGMVGMYNNGRGALRDYETFGADYRAQLQKCRATLGPA